LVFVHFHLIPVYVLQNNDSWNTSGIGLVVKHM
jgi:hypothetical protein